MAFCRTVCEAGHDVKVVFSRQGIVVARPMPVEAIQDHSTGPFKGPLRAIPAVGPRDPGLAAQCAKS